MKISLLLARAFKAFVENKIDFEELNRICHGIDTMLMINKEYLKIFASKNEVTIKEIPPYVMQNLASAGFIDMITGWDDLLSQINKLGEKFIQYIIKK